MYTVDQHDTVHEFRGLPPSSCGAPLPAVVSNERSTLVAYIVQEPDASWDGANCQVVEHETVDELIAIVRIVNCYAIMFGPPNDEAFNGHPLYSRGLKPYDAFEVINSSWVRILQRMNSVHHHHDPSIFHAKRHFILSFHDSTFECVAKDLHVVEKFRGSMNDAVSRMAVMIAADRG